MKFKLRFKPAKAKFYSVTDNDLSSLEPLYFKPQHLETFIFVHLFINFAITVCHLFCHKLIVHNYFDYEMACLEGNSDRPKVFKNNDLEMP